MKRDKNRKKNPPSREKYEKENPTVSARLPIEKRDKLLSVLRRLGLSLRNLLIGVADETDIKLQPIDEAWKEGYAAAKQKFMVPFPCAICDEPLPITGAKAKKAAGQLMSDAGWGHTECHKRRRQR